MKIIYDYQIFAMQKYGGVSRYFYEIASRIAAAGNKVQIFAPFYINEYFQNNSKVWPWGFKIPRLPKYVRAMTHIINMTLSCVAAKQTTTADIFHETYYAANNFCPHSAKRIATVHDMVHEKFAHFFPLHDKTAKYKTIAVRRADHIICVSENTRRDLVALLNVPEENTSVVHHGFSLSCAPDPIRPAKINKPFILYVGKRSGYKNFDLLLRAFSASEILQKEFSIICFGGGKVSQKERDFMAKLHLPSDRVHFMDGDDQLLAGLYTSASLFVYPSLYEGFGIPPLEAMAFGCPVVCSNTSSIPEVVGDAACLFNPESSSELQGAIEKVIFSSEYSTQLRAKGYERIKLFSWDKCAKDTLRVYEKASEI